MMINSTNEGLWSKRLKKTGNGFFWGEDLAKSGYKPDLKHKIVITFLYFWLQSENQM
jgi:hypothetical protein